MKIAVRTSFVALLAILLLSTVGAFAQEPTPPTPPPPAPAPAPAPAATPAPPPVAPAAMVEEAKIVIEDKAEADGKIEVVFTPKGGAPQTITVLVAKKMKAKEVAEDLAKNLKVTLGEGYKVEQNDEKVEIKGKDDKEFSIAVGAVTVPGMSVKIK